MWIYGVIIIFIVGYWMFGPGNGVPVKSDWNTVAQMIEQGDERNAAINEKAGLRAFEAFSVLAPLAALALYAFEQISTAGVLTIIAVEVVASIVYFAQIARMQRIM